MNNSFLKKLLVFACFTLSISQISFGQTFTDIETYDDDLDWGDERNIYDDFSPYEEDYEYIDELPQEQTEQLEQPESTFTDPVEYNEDYYDDVDLIEDEYESDYYDSGLDYDFDETYNEVPQEDTSL